MMVIYADHVEVGAATRIRWGETSTTQVMLAFQGENEGDTNVAFIDGSDARRLWHVLGQVLQQVDEDETEGD